MRETLCMAQHAIEGWELRCSFRRHCDRISFERWLKLFTSPLDEPNCRRLTDCIHQFINSLPLNFIFSTSVGCWNSAHQISAPQATVYARHRPAGALRRPGRTSASAASAAEKAEQEEAIAPRDADFLLLRAELIGFYSRRSSRANALVSHAYK